MGFGLTFTSLGIIIGPPLFGLLVDYTRNYSLGWTLLAVLLSTGALLLSFVRERRKIG